MGFGDSGRRAIYFQGFGEKGNLFSGIWGESITFFFFFFFFFGGGGVMELGRKVVFLSGSREQRPPWGPHNYVLTPHPPPPPPSRDSHLTCLFLFWWGALDVSILVVHTLS